MAAGLVFCGGLAFVSPGCTPAAAPPALAAGEKPVTGVPRYDRLFVDVHAALVAVQEARSEEADARGALARRLGLAETAPFDALGARLRERTARLAEDGLTLELEFTGIDDGDGLEQHTDANAEASGEGEPPESAGSDAADAAGDGELAPPGATLRTPGREPLRRELRLLEALAQASLSGATIYTNMGRARRRMDRLLVDIAELEARVDTTFADLGDRERVRAKLSEAKEFLPQLNAQAREVSGSADTLISLLDEAANTAPVAPQRRRGAAPIKEGPARAAPGGLPNATSTTAPFGATRPAAPKPPAPSPSPPTSAPPPASPPPNPAPPAPSSAP
jgi:hypothetical protein